MAHDEHQSGGGWFVPAAIVALIALYAVALAVGWPQRCTREIVAVQAEQGGAAGEHLPAENDEHAPKVSPPYWMLTPFVLLLAGIAVLPLIPVVEHWWESNWNRFCVAIGLSLFVLAYYALLREAPLEGHWPAHHVVAPTDATVQSGFVKTVFANAILGEFIPFIVLLFSLYTISGGIRIAGDLQAHPLTNAAFLATGALLASVIGTTGAAMLLIRPVLDTNRQRKHIAHTIVFFIFIVCNCGGCLLPLGDPPLFLGYLQGVPFFWTLELWREWLFVNGLLIVIYLLIDTLWFHRREATGDTRRDVEQKHRLQFSGWRLNVPLLLGVVLTVAMLDPSKPVLGTSWHPWMYLREIVQLGLVAVSLFFGNRHARIANHFSYAAIVEVAAVFVGIFITMQPALEILSVHGPELGIRTPGQFFWATGSLSGVLDNAPTYLVFFRTAQAMPHAPDARLVAGVEHVTLMGISLGAVFMGAMTYIGNGPNFMVRAIAEKSGVKMPSFFGYMVWSFLVLLPVLAAMMWQYLLFPY